MYTYALTLGISMKWINNSFRITFFLFFKEKYYWEKGHNYLQSLEEPEEWEE